MFGRVVVPRLSCGEIEASFASFVGVPLREKLQFEKMWVEVLDLVGRC